MKISEEITAIKMSLRTLSVKIKRIENVNKMVKKYISEKEAEQNISKVAEPVMKNKLNYFERFNLNNRIQNTSEQDS
ncbi:MAG: hypothetical protein JNJ56_04260 [Ignavibacteria bacterium]|nr:hypothetical protein [Ignavibacteria bacterium]